MTIKDIAAAFGFHPRMVDHWAARDTDSQPTAPTCEQWNALKSILDFGDSMDSAIMALNGRDFQSGKIWDDREVLDTVDGSQLAVAPGQGEDRGAIELDITAPATDAAKLWDGWGTALKPAYEIIIVAMKPLDGTFANNAMTHGVAGLNIDGGRIETSENLNGGAYTDGRTPRAMAPGGSARNAQAGDYEQPKGRWPANIILDGERVPVLRLRDGCESGIMLAIQEFFYDYELPAMWARVRDIPEPGQVGEGEVLRQGVLSQGVGIANGNHEPEVRDQAHAGSVAENETESPSKVREGQPEIQGELYVAGLSHDLPSGVVGRIVTDCEPDDNAGRDAGTPAIDGDALVATANESGGCASSERDQGRQQIGESGVAGRCNAQDVAPAGSERVAKPTERERGIEILACDIPEQWLKHFEQTGDTMRDPMSAGAMLDEQSGELTSGGGIKSISGHGIGLLKGDESYRFKHDGEETFGSTGGASRFFYCAKASRSERGEFNDHATVKPIDLMAYLCKLTDTPTGGVILDPFCGSGSTLVAAAKMGRDAVGSDLDPHHVEISRRRIAEAHGPLFGGAT